MSIPNFVYIRLVINKLGLGEPKFQKFKKNPQGPGVWQVYFTDPVTKTTLMMHADELCERTVKVKLLESRKAFREGGQNNASN